MSEALADTPRRPPRWEFVTLLASFMAINAAAIDIFIPAMQEIGRSLNVEDPNARQLIITSYLMGFGIAQLFFGPLADAFGRRVILIVGLTIFLVATIASAFALDYGILLACRFVQGVGGAATRVIAFSVVRDSYSGRQMASTMSLVMMVFMAMPIVAPNIGQLFMIFGSWRAIIWGTATFGIVIMAWSMARLPETLRPEDRRPLTIRQMLDAVRIVVTTRISLTYTIASSLMFGVLMGYINQAEQIFTERFALGATFTLWFAATAILMAGVAFVNSRLVQRLGMRRLSHGALLAFIGLTSLHFVVALAVGEAQPFWLFYVLVVPMFCCFGFINTNFNALAMEPLGHVAGTASSIIGFCQTMLGGLCGGILGYFYDGSLVPLLAGFLILGSLALGLVLYGERGRLFHVPPEEI